MKWVACTGYFFDCKARVLEKKSDEEVDGDIQIIGAGKVFADENLQDEGG